MNKTEIKLKVAAEEIKEILRKHDIAAVVTLHSPGHGEYFFHLNPSYSCAYVYNDNELRFYSKKEDYNSPEEQFEKQNATVNMMRILTDLAGMNYMMLEPLTRKIEEITQATHTKGIMK
jgi:hypothetical protein